MTSRPPRTAPDPGFELCDRCNGTRLCPWCEGKGYILDVPGKTGAQSCTFCDYGTCSQCLGEGQMPVGGEHGAIPPQTITFEQGNEFAADSPWGFQRVRVSTDGSLEYEHRARGTQRSLRGAVDGERVKQLDAALGRTTFPQKPQEKFRPGSSVIRLTTSPPTYSVLIDYFEGMKMDGYREVIGELSALNNALRESDDAVLQSWRFEPAPGVSA